MLELADGSVNATPLLRRRMATPALPARTIDRPRLEGTIARGLQRTPVVILSATAGSGKTTAVVRALAQLDWPAAWLTLDAGDQAPGRLLAYVEGALQAALQLRGEPVRSMLAAGVPHSDAAGLMLEGAAAADAVLVLDDIDRIQTAPRAWAVLEAVVRYRPDQLRIVLISRRPVHLGHGSLDHDRVTWILEQDLAFDTDEVRAVLELVENVDLEAEAVLRATGGWATGVVFDAYRHAQRESTLGGVTDPLHGYLATQILSGLPKEDQQFLVTTSVLDEVTADRARLLGVEEATQRLSSLRRANLPGTWSSPGQFRCHSRFREFLESLLDERPVREVRELFHRLGLLLEHEGQPEEAVEALLRAEALPEAAVTAARILPLVLDRADLDVADRWLDRLRRVDDPPLGLVEAEVILAAGREEFARVVAIADELEETGRLDSLIAASSRAAALIAWASAHAGRIDALRRIAAALPPGPEATAITYMRHLIDPSQEAPMPVPSMSGGPLDALVIRDHYIYGRLDRVLRESRTGWVGGVATPWRIAALRACGRVTEAVALLQAAQESGLASLGLQTVVAPEVRLDAGDPHAAWAMLEEALPVAEHKGSELFACLGRCVAAKVAARGLGDLDLALGILEDVTARRAGRYRYTQELVRTWKAFALLGKNMDEEALVELRGAVESMVAGARVLELPTAAIYLAEACWRTGDEPGADEAADIALEAAQRQGSDHLLLQALADFPSVLSRRLDAERDADSVWHRLGRSLQQNMSRDPMWVGETSVHLHDLGRPSLTRDDVPVRARLSKALEVLAYLKSKPSHDATRDELIEVLFDGRADDSARSYLRQALHWLRQALPAGHLETDSSRPIRLLEPGGIGSDADDAIRLLRECKHLHGSEGLRLVRAGLALIARGEYMEGCESPWAVDRRVVLTRLTEEARCAAAELAFEAGILGEAMQLSEEILRADPYRENVWRLRMRAAGALGDEAEVIDSYRRCREALGELGADVAPATTSLLKTLRR